MTGLRQLQRQRVQEAISAAAITLFLARGFDEVPVTEVAAAAGVSKPTLFKYFPAKEDLVLHRIGDHQGEAARVVRGREPGEHPVDALRRHFLDGLARHEPVTGLNDHPEVVGFHRMIFGTPSLSARVLRYVAADEAALAEALASALERPSDAPLDRLPDALIADTPHRPADAPPPDALGRPMLALTADLLAAQVLAAQRVLARHNWALLAAGRLIADVEPEAVRAAAHAFTMLRALVP
jgi:AcrR family transcriptional regulator